MNISNVMNLLNVSANVGNKSVGSREHIDGDKKAFLKEMNKTDVRQEVPTDNDETLNVEEEEIQPASLNKLIVKQESMDKGVHESQKTEEDAKELLELLKNISIVMNPKSTPDGDVLDKETLNQYMEELSTMLKDVSEALETVQNVSTSTIEAMEKIQEFVMSAMESNNAQVISNNINKIKSELLALKNEEIDGIKPIDFQNLNNKITSIENSLIEQVKHERNQIDMGYETIVETIVQDSSVGNEEVDALPVLSLENEINVEDNTNINAFNKDIKLDSSSVQKGESKTIVQMKTDILEKVESLQKIVVSRERIYINLNPKQLGNVEIMFEKNEDGLQIAIEFEEGHSKKQLETLVDELRKEMKEKAVEINLVFKEKNKEEENSQKKNDSRDKEGILEQETADEKSSIEIFNELIEKLTKGGQGYDNS